MPYPKIITPEKDIQILQMFEDGKSRAEIARFFNVNSDAIKRSLQRNGIEPVQNRNTEDLRYQNKEWLKEQIYNSRSCREIADMCNVPVPTVGNFVNKFKLHKTKLGIPFRASNFQFSKYQTDVINGCLLSDAHLKEKRPSGFTSAFILNTANEHFAKQVSKILFNEDLTKRIKVVRGNDQYRIQKYDVVFGAMRDKWYPSGLKTIPNDLELTPAVLRWWYIGDGCLITKPKQKEIFLCSEGFTKQDNFMLVDKLSDIGIKATARRCAKFNIYISSYDHRKFLDMVGEPLKGYEHKWNL